MLSALAEATVQSEDIVEHAAFEPVQTVRSGRRGRPRKEIDPHLLESSLRLRGVTHIAPVFGCSSRTVRRRALEYGLVEPCPPVYIIYEDPDSGEHVRFYRSSTAAMSDLTDHELDMILRHILEIFPAFGRRMITGHLRFLGHHIPRARIRQSYERVTGAPAYLTSRPVERRNYHVAGPNSLWHHDGQHGVCLYLTCKLSYSTYIFSFDSLEGSYPCFC